MANEVELEELRDQYQELLRQYGGTNLAGQQAPDGTYGYYTPDFSYGSYKIPYQDPTYSSGYEYARTIAGGMPFEDVVAPGMSFSPDKPMGYTQEDLTPRFYNEGPVPVMPSAPTKGTPLEASYETMPYAPVGTPAPERYIPGQTAFPGIPDFLRDLNLSGLKDLDFSSLPKVTEEVAGEPGPVTDFFKVDQNLFNFEEIADKIDMEEVAKIDIEKINIPETVSVFSDILKDPIVDLERMQPQKTIPSVFDSVMPVAPMSTPEPKLPKSVLANIPDVSNIPMNFTGLPNMPVIPQPIVPTPVIPQIPVMPQIPQTAYIPPASSFIQPRVEEIVSPIRSGSSRSFQQPGLFNLV